MMTKCDFCTESSPKGKCFWSTLGARRSYCEKAIKRMTEAFKGANSVKDLKRR